MINRLSSDRQTVVLDSHSQRMYRMRKGVMTSARLINDRLSSDKSQRWVPLMVTLTYRNADDWCPEHVSDFLRRVQKYAKRRGHKLPYVWVMELQKRGAPHYHVLLWIPRRWRLPHADRQGWWAFGSTNLVRVRNAVGYVAKYASKGLDCAGHDFPKGARVHGIGGLTAREAMIIAWWKLPKDLRLGEEGSHVWRRVPGGGWRCIVGDAAGRFVKAEWGLSAVNAEDKRVRLVKLPEGIEAMPGRIAEIARQNVEVWKESIYYRSIALVSGKVHPLEKDRVVWLSGAEVGARAILVA